jgi:hypothetical protein
MTPESTPFDHRPDPLLGAALREALTPSASDAFVARVLQQIGTARPLGSTWTVLASWSRAGIVGAAAVALVAGLLLARGRLLPVSIDDVVVSEAGGNGTLARAIESHAPSDASIVFSSYEEP